MELKNAIIGHNNLTKFYYFPATKGYQAMVSDIKLIKETALIFIHRAKTDTNIYSTIVERLLKPHFYENRKPKTSRVSRIVYISMDNIYFGNVLGYLESLPSYHFHQCIQSRELKISEEEMVAYCHTKGLLHLLRPKDSAEMNPVSENTDSVPDLEVFDYRTKLYAIRKKNGKEWAHKKANELVKLANEATHLLYGSRHLIYKGNCEIAYHAKRLMSEHVRSDKLCVSHLSDDESVLEYLF